MDLLDCWAAASARQVGRYIGDGAQRVKLGLAGALAGQVSQIEVMAA